MKFTIKFKKKERKIYSDCVFFHSCRRKGHFDHFSHGKVTLLTDTITIRISHSKTSREK